MNENEDTLEVSEEDQRAWQKEFPPKPATSHTALAEDYDPADAYEIDDPKHPDFLENLFDRAEARDSRD